MKQIIAASAGLMFGLGLILSGMSDPGKVLGFLDLSGAWDPSLAWVMIGAIAVGSVGLRRAEKQPISWSGQPTELPAKSPVQARLVTGGLIFGAGWGLAGICPGPDLILISEGNINALAFGLAMLAGIWIHDRPWHR